MGIDLGLLFMSFISALIGAAAVLIGQAIQHFQNTWTCPMCEPPLKFKVSTEDELARKAIAEEHLQDSHSQ